LLPALLLPVKQLQENKKKKNPYVRRKMREIERNGITFLFV